MELNVYKSTAHIKNEVFFMFRATDFITYGRTKMAILVIFCFAISYNLSRFFEITWHVDEISGKADIVTTAMRQNAVYISVYITWMYLVFMYALPFSGLSVLNMLMFLDVRWVKQINVRI